MIFRSTVSVISGPIKVESTSEMLPEHQTVESHREINIRQQFRTGGAQSHTAMLM
jgi:hypothetical protein